MKDFINYIFQISFSELEKFYSYEKLSCKDTIISYIRYANIFKKTHNFSNICKTFFIISDLRAFFEVKATTNIDFNLWVCRGKNIYTRRIFINLRIFTMRLYGFFLDLRITIRI